MAYLYDPKVIYLRRPTLALGILFLMVLSSLAPFGSISGSPGPASSASLETYLEDDILSNITYDISSSPVYINNSITVGSGYRLTFLPGTSIVFGSGSGIIVNGELIIGGEGPNVSIEGNSTGILGYWNGISFMNGSLGRFEGVDIQGAITSISMLGTRDVVIRNSTIGLDVTPLYLNGSSMLRIYNSTLDYSNITVKDQGSMVKTYHFFGGRVLDHISAPVDQARVEIRSGDDSLLQSHITNTTGEFPFTLLEGMSFRKDGRDEGNATYEVMVTDDIGSHFSNISYIFNGTARTDLDIRFSWPPELSSVPMTINVVEDRTANHNCRILDRNGVGRVEFRSSSTSVSYNAAMERIEFLYENETIIEENVTITLDDSYDTRQYHIMVNVTPVDDPPMVIFQGGFVYPREDEPAYYNIEIEDEDTPLEMVMVTTEDPDNITYDRENERLVFLYRDGTPLEFSVNITVSDGTTSIMKELFIFFQPVFYSPEFLVPLPTINTSEDEEMVLDLTQYIYDPDQGERLFLSARTEDHEIFSITLDGFVLTVVPAPDAFGEGSIQLTLRDEREMMTMVHIGVNVTAVDDPPILISPSIEEAESGSFWINVTYGDVDGDLPDSIRLLIDDEEFDMTTDPIPVPDPTTGVRYRYKLYLVPGEHDISFRTVQGDFIVNLSYGMILVEEKERAFQLTGYNGSLIITIWGLGEGSPMLIEASTGPEPQEDSISLGCSFSIDSAGILPTRAWVTIWPFDFREDILAISLNIQYLQNLNWSTLGSGIFDESIGSLSFALTDLALNSTIAVMVSLDPEFDSDGDGIKNMLDAFPDDPDEWDDTDSDGIGDNGDDDDDNDGFNDTFEISSGTDPLSDLSFPIDTDLDGTYDHLDTDDDGDGIPDLWEVEKGLDPLDPSDADDDPDEDGATNLEEFLRNTHPFNDDREKGSSSEPPGWLVYAVVLVLMVLIAVGIGLFFISRSSHREEVVEAEDEWEIQGELDPDEAIDCPECGSIYPLWFEKCPKCGEINPYEE